MLVEDEATSRPKQARDLRNRARKVEDVMQRPTCHDRIEALAGLEFFERHGLKELTFGRVRIDGDHPVA
jgi:hypothetical protein